MPKILIVEDDEVLLESLKDCLSLEHHTIESVTDGSSGLDRMLICEYDLIILDWGLPNLSGLELCKRFRDSGGNTPVLMLTGKRSMEEKESGFDVGADDYPTKPFNMRELNARVRALIRRSGRRISGKVLKVGDVELDPSNFRVTRSGREVRLIPKEFALLELMMRNPGQLFSADALFNRVWTADENASPDIVRTHIKNLRKKLEAGSQDRIIHTIHGVGYRVGG